MARNPNVAIIESRNTCQAKGVTEEGFLSTEVDFIESFLVQRVLEHPKRP